MKLSDWLVDKWKDKPECVDYFDCRYKPSMIVMGTPSPSPCGNLFGKFLNDKIEPEIRYPQYYYYSTWQELKEQKTLAR